MPASRRKPAAAPRQSFGLCTILLGAMAFLDCVDCLRMEFVSIWLYLILPCVVSRNIVTLNKQPRVSQSVLRKSIAMYSVESMSIPLPTSELHMIIRCGRCGCVLTGMQPISISPCHKRTCPNMCKVRIRAYIEVTSSKGHVITNSGQEYTSCRPLGRPAMPDLGSPLPRPQMMDGPPL